MTATTIDLLLRSTDTSWSYSRWEQLPADDKRYEVIDGVLYMTTAPSSFHQWIVQRLLRLVGWPLEDQGLAYSFIAPIGVLMPGCDPVQPDFLLISRSNAGIIANRRIRGVPDLIAEVLSPSNPEQDTDVKRGAYARAGLPEYWVIRPQTRDVLICWQPDQMLGDFAQVRLIGPDDLLVAETIAGITLRVSDLFAGSPDTTL